MYHDLQNGKLIEVRKTPRPDVNDDEIYYIVHHVRIGHANWYHHGVILADQIDMLYTGVLLLKDAILKELDGAKADVSTVFMRSLMALNEEVVSAVETHGIQSEIADIRATPQQGQFVVMGIRGDKEIVLMNVTAQDAFVAVSNSVSAAFEQGGATFVPLESSFIDPAIEEINLHYRKAMDGIKSMLEASPVTVH